MILVTGEAKDLRSHCMMTLLLRFINKVHYERMLNVRKDFLRT